jgi:hypothetical protein
MAKIHVTAQRDFLESLSSTKPLSALAELVWNGFDAESDRVEIHLELNELKSLQSIHVRDYGYGIDSTKVETLFGSLGNSWKKECGRQKGRALHGKNGKGRFKAFALGEHVEWNTTYRDNGKTYSYKIIGKTSSLDDFETTEPVEDEGKPTGTEVVIYKPSRNFRSLQDESAPLELAKMFAAYLTEYPTLQFDYNGFSVDPKSVQDRCSDYHLGEVELRDGRNVVVALSIIEWSIQTDRVLHLCDANGIALHEIESGRYIRAPGFHFTGYIKSDHFRELDKLNLLALAEMHPDVLSIVNVAKTKIKEHFRKRSVEDQGKIIDRWKKEQIYPYDDRADLDPVEEAERQVFDILAVNVQSYLPSFEDADAKSKKFTFLLLAQAIRENPESVQKIISEVLGLKKDEQDDLAKLLQHTSLSSIISSAKIVANRFDFLNGLDSLLFNKESKKKFLERDQLHKILENEAWLFDEEFSLSGSEMRLEEVLNKHRTLLGKREDDPASVEVGEGRTGRIDLMLHKAIQPRTGEYDYLIVELKRPSKKIDGKVLIQIKEYAMAVAKDERFRDINIRWKFIAISNDLDDLAKSEASQRNRQKGIVYDDDKLNLTVWARSWADVINDARSRLHFVNTQLSYEANQESAKAYLRKTHAKFIPDTAEMRDDDVVNP